MEERLDSWRIWNSFFDGKEHRKEQFRPDYTYVGAGLRFNPENGETQYEHDARIMKNEGHFVYCFDLHLRELGYRPSEKLVFDDPLDKTKKHEWTKYLPRNNEDATILVNFDGMKIYEDMEGNGPWADICIMDFIKEKKGLEYSLAEAFDRAQKIR